MPATANGANNVAVPIPCDRVIRSDGRLGGYAYGLGIKRALLERERGGSRDQQSARSIVGVVVIVIVAIVATVIAVRMVAAPAARVTVVTGR